MSKPFQDKQYVIDELTAICNSLGKIDENDGTYMKDRDCKASLREITRYLNTDSKPFVVRAFLGQINIIKSDLIPLLVQYCDYNDGDTDLFTTILRLCTNLTSSVLLLFENEDVPSELEDQQIYNKLLKCLFGYKEAFASDDKIWSALNVHLRHNLDDEIAFERLIILIRNILHIPVDSTSDLGIHSDFDTHDMCLYRIDKSGMLSTIIKIAAETEKGTEYCLHIMEIVYLMLRDQNPETLATARPYAVKRTLDDLDADKKRYAELSARAKREREMKNKVHVGQLRFRNTTFVVQNYRSLTNEPLLVHHPTDRRETIDLNKGKTELRKAKNKKALSSETSMVFSDRNTKVTRVSYSLRNFCKLFVERIYNNYMQQIKHNLIQKKTQENDESYYLWAIQFFTKFTRHIDIDTSHISETLSTSTLHYIQILITSYQDKLKIEKKKFQDISKRLHLAIRAYREILHLLNSVKPGSDFRKTAETIQKNIFTETEYSTLILTLFQQYAEQKHSLHYLEDLIMTNDIFAQLLKEFSETHAAVHMEEENGKQQQQQLEVSGEKPEKKKRKSKKTADFRATHFMSRYCCPDVINAYLMKLKDFKNNDDSLNLAILTFLERIVYDCKQDVIFFQASVFKCLLDIMGYHESLPGYSRFVELGKHLMANFGRMANKRRWMFQELLFWKTASDCVEIENAIDPPPPMPVVEQDDDMELPLEAGENEELPADTLSQLKAELADSSDSDWDEAARSIPNPMESQSQPKDTIADLIAELDDAPLHDASIPSPPAETNNPSVSPAPEEASISSLSDKATTPSPLPSLPPSPVPSELSE